MWKKFFCTILSLYIFIIPKLNFKVKPNHARIILSFHYPLSLKIPHLSKISLFSLISHLITSLSLSHSSTHTPPS